MTISSSLSIQTIDLNSLRHFQLCNISGELINHKRIQRLINDYNFFFYDIQNYILKKDITYVELTELIRQLERQLKRIDGPKLVIDPNVSEFIESERYAIEEQRIAGLTIKAQDPRWTNELAKFKSVLDVEITRPLKKQQLEASFYLATMKRAANFSVPGAGKTAMMYGTFAYFSSSSINLVNRLVVVCPLNAFEAWRKEFHEVFAHKRTLYYMNLKDAKYKHNGAIRSDWGISNVIVINYEALNNKLKILNELIDKKTMLVFDEVHRVKNPHGQRAQNALSLGAAASYRFVLTGTPIPNTYQDIYNFLHLLYDKEYPSFFGWEINELKEPNTEKVNEKLAPFFWRTNKKDLKVPPADPDFIFEESPTNEQLELVKVIYECEQNLLALYIRLLQASTNPTLLNSKIDYAQLGYVEEEIDYTYFGALDDEEREKAKQKRYAELNLTEIKSNKFERGIKLVKKLVNQNKKVIIWAIFVGTMQKIQKHLKKSGISVHLIYGATAKERRVDMIDEFRDGDIEVLISNPATLGEGISLHQTVHDAVYFEFDFNLTFMLQSRDRIHRLGLKETDYTRYYYLITQGSRADESFIDKAVYNKLKQKEEIMLNAIESSLLVPEVTDSYLEQVKDILKK